MEIVQDSGLDSGLSFCRARVTESTLLYGLGAGFVGATEVRAVFVLTYCQLLP